MIRGIDHWTIFLITVFIPLRYLSDEGSGAKLRVTENRCVLFNSLTYLYLALLPQYWALYAKVDSTPTFIYLFIIYICTYIYCRQVTPSGGTCSVLFYFVYLFLLIYLSGTKYTTSVDEIVEFCKGLQAKCGAYLSFFQYETKNRLNIGMDVDLAGVRSTHF